MQSMTFEVFKAGALARGFDEVVERVWAGATIVDTHTHAFGVEALVVAGDMWLTEAGVERHLYPGDTFVLDFHVPHAERYGETGATYWAARRNTPLATQQ